MTIMNKSQVRDAIREAKAHPGGVLGIMRDLQTSLGRTIVPLGSTTPFPVPKWDWSEALISVDEVCAFIVIVHASRKRRGAFRRLVENIRKAGLTPVVCSPIGLTMSLILEKWGWVEIIPGSDYWASREGV